MTIREQIIAMQLSCNIERALLLILDNCGCDESILLNDLASIKWDIQRSLEPSQNSKLDAQVSGDINKIDITTRLIDLNIATINNHWLNYNPKVFLERYKHFKQRGVTNQTTGETSWQDVKAGFKREDFTGENLYNRVNEFTGITGDDTLDIKMQTYFTHYENNGIVKSIGMPLDYSTGVQAKQIFRFALELEVDGKTIVLNSPSFQVLCNSNSDNTSEFYYGIAFAYGGDRR